MLTIELEDLEISEAANQIAWKGLLVADGMPVCRLASASGSELMVLSWVRGCGPSDLAAVEEDLALQPRTSIPAAGVAPATERPDTLLERCADLVAFEHVSRNLSKIMEGKVLYLADGIPQSGTVPLGFVTIPEGGSVTGAIEFVRASHPKAAILNLMSIEDATATMQHVE